MTGTVGHVALAMVLFVGGHFILSAPPVRKPLVAMLGEWPFLGLYSLIALILLAWVLLAYAAAPTVAIWTPPTGLRHLSLSVMPFACILAVAALTTPNPSVAGVDGGAIARRGPRGILKITRHPMMWGFGLWGITHLLANGDAAGMILFGGMTVLALGGALAIDARKRAQLGTDWEVYCDQSSYLPFAAIVAGRTRVSLREIGYARLAGGVALYVVLLAAHGWLFGVDPWPL
jgi:uncharacterized membrane protein